MKIKLIIFTLIAGLLASCTAPQSNDFEAKINIKGVTSKRVYITVFGDRENTVVNYSDSVKTVVDAQDGTFTISGTLSEPAVLRVSFSDDKQFYKMTDRGYFPVKSANLWFIATPGGKLDITGDLSDKDFIAVYPEGDFENNTFALLNAQMMPLLNEGGNISVKFEVDSTLSDSDKEQMKARDEEIDKEIAAIREKFVSENPSSIAALWLMEDMLIRKQIKTGTLEPLLEKVDPKYHNNYFYISVKNRVDGAKSAVVGAQCPPVKGTDQFGKEFDITSLQGKFVIVDFWGTWCGACLAGMPDMKAFKEAHSDVVEIVGVAKDSDVEAWKECIEKHGMEWPNILIGTGEFDYASKFNVQGYPTKILLGPDGKILYRGTGESKEFYTEIEKIISQNK